eukprot:759529-Hanusia_phi.AAC.9
MSAGAKSGENGSFNSLHSSRYSLIFLILFGFEDCDTHSSERENLLSGWLKKFYNSQKTDLKPWVFCDGSKGFSYIEGPGITTKTPRMQMASFLESLMGMPSASTSMLLVVVYVRRIDRCFSALGSTDLTKICDEGSPPTVVKALDTAYIRCQELMPTDYPLAQSEGKGITKSGRYETESHGLTGDLKVDARRNFLCHMCLKIAKDGSPNGMNNDPTGVGFREFELLRKKHNFAPSRRPFNISNMPGEERWRVLEVEPTRAVGHRMKKEHPLQHPEVFEWKEAFRTPDMVTHFLTDPVGYCKRPDFFTGTCLEALLIKIHEADSLPDPGQVSMSELFDAIFNVVYNKLSDDTWTSAYESAHEYLQMFANEKPVPNIRTSPAKTILAACYLAVLMVSDDNVSCSMVILDGKKHFGGESFELGVAAHECP